MRPVNKQLLRTLVLIRREHKGLYINSTSFFPSPSNQENAKTTEVKGPASFLKRALWVLQHYEHIVFTCFMKGRTNV